MVTTNLTAQLLKLIRSLFALDYVQEQRIEAAAEIDMELALAEYYSFSDAVLMANGCSDIQ